MPTSSPGLPVLPDGDSSDPLQPKYRRRLRLPVTSSDDAVGESVHVFVLDRTYVFKRYFGENELFEALSEFYDNDEYRFEVPQREWAEVAETLREYGYAPEVVDDVEEFVVVKEEYTKHAEILKDSVEYWTRRGYNFFLMKDLLAAERAVQEHGATPAAETDLAVGV